MVDGSIRLAWGLTVAASLSTLLGASVVLCSKREHVGAPAQNSWVAGSLGLAAGAMMFVAVAELFPKAEENFAEDGYSERAAKFFSALSFFAGCIVVIASGYVAQIVAPEHEKFELHAPHAPAEIQASQAQGDAASQLQGDAVAVSGDVASEVRPGADIHQCHCHASGDSVCKGDEAKLRKEDVDKQMFRLGLKATAAVVLHNFPEGLAAFSGAVADGRTGFGIAFGVILHNIPEGFCVAGPIFFATRNRTQALLWAAVAGLAELAGGAAGHAILASSGRLGDSEDAGDLGVSGASYGVLFGLVNGIVVTIACLEFLPKAVQLEAASKVGGRLITPLSFVAGMALIALTLIMETE